MQELTSLKLSLFFVSSDLDCSDLSALDMNQCYMCQETVWDGSACLGESLSKHSHLLPPLFLTVALPLAFVNSPPFVCSSVANCTELPDNPEECDSCNMKAWEPAECIRKLKPLLPFFFLKLTGHDSGLL